MTQQEILDRMQFIGELRGLDPSTLYNYYHLICQYQEHLGKSADQLDIGNVQKIGGLYRGAGDKANPGGALSKGSTM